MSRWGNCDFRELRDFQEKLNQLNSGDVENFCKDCARELAARLLAKAIRRTPVGVYSSESGKTGGTLRRGWTASGNASGSVSGTRQYVNSLEIHHNGRNYTIEITNPVEYATYVEYGHRTRGGRGWKNGVFMLTISENEVNAQASSILEQKLMQYLREVF